MSGERLSTGISGLDEVLHGGYLPHQTYLVRGGPGMGKTTLGLQFLATGARLGESGLLITLGESVRQLQQTAATLGLDLSSIDCLDLSPTTDFFTEVRTYDLFTPAEVDRDPITQQIVSRVESLKPDRIFIDAMTQFRYLSSDAFQFRKQVLSFLRFLVENYATVLFTSESSREAPDDDLQFMSDGVINLDYLDRERTLHVSKLRGSDFRSGSHALSLTAGGMVVFPRLVPEQHSRAFNPEKISAGIPEIDELLHGGLERGTITIISGASGVGKSTLGLQFMKEAAGRGEHSIVYAFEERRETLLHRAESVNVPVHVMIDRGTLSVEQVEPLSYSPDEFANLVKQQVEARQAQIVMIDSVSGYKLSVRGGDLIHNLHALCKYLQNMGIAVILINETEVIAGGEFRVTEIGISYLADNIVFLRYLEVQGELRRAIGVLKKRMSSFERTLREFEITRYGIKVGKPLTQLRGILRGIPEFVDLE